MSRRRQCSLGKFFSMWNIGHIGISLSRDSFCCEVSFYGKEFKRKLHSSSIRFCTCYKPLSALANRLWICSAVTMTELLPSHSYEYFPFYCIGHSEMSARCKDPVQYGTTVSLYMWSKSNKDFGATYFTNYCTSLYVICIYFIRSIYKLNSNWIMSNILFRFIEISVNNHINENSEFLVNQWMYGYDHLPIIYDHSEPERILKLVVDWNRGCIQKGEFPLFTFNA